MTHPARPLRDRVAEILATYAVDAFSSVHAGVHACTAKFPEHFSDNEVRCFRTLADRVLDNVNVEITSLRSEVERLTRNRDMWKGQCERQAEKLTVINALPHPCVESMGPQNQRQVDEHGEFVAVSRQAVDEIYSALTIARAALQQGDQS